MNAASFVARPVPSKMRTPWGTSDSVKVVAPGIRRVTTPGHGGYKLDAKTNAKVHQAWRRAGGWYEEDCEWAIVALTFPSAAPFSGHMDHAVCTAKDCFPDGYTAATGAAVALCESLVLRQRHDAEVYANSWIVTAAYAWHPTVPSGMVGVVATLGGKRFRGTPEKWALMPAADYDDRSKRCSLGFVLTGTEAAWEAHP